MRVLVTGARGFIGKNLCVFLAEHPGVEVLAFGREEGVTKLRSMVAAADRIVHLAGANRPTNPAEFVNDNVELTAALCEAVEASGRPIPICYASSAQAVLDNPYGRSKLAAEGCLEAFSRRTASPVEVFRLPNVFGKWCRPGYNSAVATFCHNVARGLPILVNESAPPVSLVYIDDVVHALLESLLRASEGYSLQQVAPVYEATPRELAERIRGFHETRERLMIDRVGTGLVRALYATYVSYLPPESFSYGLPRHRDTRGEFVEMLKTGDSGQWSYFTARPGVTRGGHYHHTKTEKFLVVRGAARFRFRHLITGEYRELRVSGDEPQVVDTIPGWTHDITNEGVEELVVMLWANEVFDRARPDTIARPLSS